MNALVFDHGRGIRSETLFRNSGNGGFPVTLGGLNHSRRFYRWDSIWNVKLSAICPWVPNPITRMIRTSSAWLDISGGDSFTDLYGQERFESMVAPKELALRLGVPVILLPQTYGPFNDETNRKRAATVIQQARLAIARDAESFQVLKQLAGNEFNDSRHLMGVDSAFLLPVAETPDHRSVNLVDRARQTSSRVVGLNVSGLIYNDPTAQRERFGFKANYRDVILGLVRKQLADPKTSVVLIPHVVPDDSAIESDTRACRQVLQEFAEEADAGRVLLAPDYSDPRQVKWLISKMDWFCGTRMHSTIAGLSTCVPTTAIAYSMKTRGVFATCKQPNCVVDPRDLNTADTLQAIESCFLSRDEAKRSLTEALPVVKDTASHQMASVASAMNVGEMRKQDF